ncbi:polysaccharide biosynthesis/export family protein [Novosphingobium sp.]|uniref:polysaccharide biosynthesis/export family protein n=1 Tax=Novosphingobium sp. TaxID=1874826 RepID=UPI0035B09114
MRPQAPTAQALATTTLALVLLALGGCSSLGSSGPTTKAVRSAGTKGAVGNADIKVVELSEPTAKRVMSAQREQRFSDSLGDGSAYGAVIGRGDVLDVAIWEAPPAALYGSALGDPRLTSSGSTARGTSLPEQMVDAAGQINVPFVGAVRVAGRTPQQIEREIVQRLTGLAHQPQAIVRVIRNATANVTIVGEVTNNTRIPLTPKGERLLDVLATAGGVRQPVGKTTIQISRLGKVASMPLDQIIRDPDQNIRMQADDVVTALFQPFSFTALGAVGNNAEISFEGTGITLAQALGRIGGLRDDRADVRGVFVFRLEEPDALDSSLAGSARRTLDGKIPVIYRLDLHDPASFFVAQSFPIRNRDVVYVSNAPVADLQKFVNIVSSMAFSIVGVANTL